MECSVMCAFYVENQAENIQYIFFIKVFAFEKMNFENSSK